MRTETISIRLRTCTSCGHLECPCCRDWCDECFEDGVECAENLECSYSEPMDEDGYVKLDELLKTFKQPALSTQKGAVVIRECA